MKCVICGKKFDGYGNNAYPIAEGKCCDKCNAERVIPARIEEMLNYELKVAREK